ncbi:Nose resistant-to-fluoxetine protein, N-terminal,Acyltransferase 3 [Cinara cedri]|uniref:Nose resistant-to-fluoxetine protein, N-terminal,Acyltransferase 3 n=1 Tax=Cinara cedri TaxID=506608 RepID=A0A5E4LY04_9HEMI|nr:Nose resistant-to-fluoxetine protein, N-terminal,Acyltransferase 3 [Cinara cedri]
MLMFNSPSINRISAVRLRSSKMERPNSLATDSEYGEECVGIQAVLSLRLQRLAHTVSTVFRSTLSTSVSKKVLLGSLIPRSYELAKVQGRPSSRRPIPAWCLWLPQGLLICERPLGQLNHQQTQLAELPQESQALGDRHRGCSTDMVAVIPVIYFLTFVTTTVTSGETHEFRQPQWITKILYGTLESYVPVGGPKCTRDGQAYKEGLKELKLWATQMYDASAKFPTGILSGKSIDFGDYDECLETDMTGLDFKSQYCIVKINFSPSDKLYPNYYKIASPNLTSSVPVWEAIKLDPNPAKVQRNEVSTAVCIPSSCTDSDLQSTLAPKIESAFIEHNLNATVRMDSFYCTTQHEKPPITLGFIIFWCFLFVMCMLVTIGTLYDVYSKRDDEFKKKSILVAFSIPSNMKKLMSNNEKTAEFCGINILKIFSCLIVLFGHRIMYIGAHPLYNINKLEESYSIMVYGIIHNGPLVVDIFFVLSGFLTFHSMHSHLVKTKRFNMPLILFLRWCRLMPIYGVLIAFHAFVFLHLSDGPLWKNMAVKESENCINYWWTNVLFINNYVHVERPCMIQSWYLACDLHLCAVGILIVYLIWKYPKFGIHILLAAITVSCFISSYVVYYHKLQPTFLGFISALKSPSNDKTYTLLYVPTHTRATPYFVGMFAAYVYQKIKVDRPDYRFSHPTTYLFGLTAGAMLWMMSIFYFLVNEYNLWSSIVYAFVFRLVFAFFVSAAIIISSVNVHFIGVWTHALAPLSRLTYSAYLAGLTIQLYHVSTARTPTYFNELQIPWITYGDWWNGFLFALFLYLLIECPFENLLRQLVSAINGTGKQRTEERILRYVSSVPKITRIKYNI